MPWVLLNSQSPCPAVHACVGASARIHRHTPLGTSVSGFVPALSFPTHLVFIFGLCISSQWWKAVLEPKWLRRQVRGDPGSLFAYAPGRATAPCTSLAVLVPFGTHDAAKYVAIHAVFLSTLRDARRHHVLGGPGRLCSLRDARRRRVSADPVQRRSSWSSRWLGPTE